MKLIRFKPCRLSLDFFVAEIVVADNDVVVVVVVATPGRD